MVMATGIVSIALRLEGIRHGRPALFWLNLVFYAALWALSSPACMLVPGRFLADLRTTAARVGFFTRSPARASWATSSC